MAGPRLHIDVLTLFPNLFQGPFDESMLKQARKKGLITTQVRNLRDYALDKRRTCDDKPFGGGPGMVMMIQPIDDCLKDIKGGHRILVSPRGKTFDQKMARQLAKKKHLVFVCGHYEGIDERVHELTDEEISIGDFVTTGGEFPALCMIDAVIRWVPGVLGNEDSLKSESFSGKFLDFPQYTRPRDFKGSKVPEVLFSGDHKKIEKWRATEALKLTKKNRPDLLD